MDSSAVGGVVFGEICQHGSGGEWTANRVNEWPATNLWDRTSTKAKSNNPELPNTTLMDLLRRVSNGKDLVLSPNQLDAE